MSWTRSLRFRLLLLAVIVLLTVLAVAAFGLNTLFYRHLERRIGQELDTHISQIAGGLRYSGDGRLTLSRMPADPRFQRPFGGLYWQVIDETGHQSLRSRSLWDTELGPPDDRLLPGAIHVHTIEGPQGSTLLLHEQLLLIPDGVNDHAVRVSVAVDRSELQELGSSFSRDTALALAVLGCVLLAGFAFQISAGLRPMSQIRKGVTAIRSGSKLRLDTDVPVEVEPLVSELNALLDSQEAEMKRAHDRAADLAHGLKTPLTALAADIRTLHGIGQTELADNIEHLAERMRNHVERELVASRLRHGPATARLHIAPVVEAIVKTLKRLPKGAEIRIETDLENGLMARIDREDFGEVVGNLGENAVRHCKSQVRITSRTSEGSIVLCVEDDGEGVPPDQLSRITARGRRLDEKGGAAGLGLAIVQDILDEVGGRLELDRSGLGGLLATVFLPRV